jgi:hypothetical protein
MARQVEELRGHAAGVVPPTRCDHPARYSWFGGVNRTESKISL